MRGEATATVVVKVFRGIFCFVLCYFSCAQLSVQTDIVYIYLRFYI